mmetsp:Transcript_5187/g.13551  ORF Transcript_5187/g.13551 Transcript_5187/m.13551 type:complete len:228 (+) Transcript_5187:57-740(+)
MVQGAFTSLRRVDRPNGNIPVLGCGRHVFHVCGETYRVACLPVVLQYSQWPALFEVKDADVVVPTGAREDPLIFSDAKICEARTGVLEDMYALKLMHSFVVLEHDDIHISPPANPRVAFNVVNVHCHDGLAVEILIHEWLCTFSKVPAGDLTAFVTSPNIAKAWGFEPPAQFQSHAHTELTAFRGIYLRNLDASLKVPQLYYAGVRAWKCDRASLRRTISIGDYRFG